MIQTRARENSGGSRKYVDHAGCRLARAILNISLIFMIFIINGYIHRDPHHKIVQECGITDDFGVVQSINGRSYNGIGGVYSYNSACADVLSHLITS